MKPERIRKRVLEHLVCDCGFDEEEIDKLLPKQFKVSPRSAMSPSQRRVFEQVVRRRVTDAPTRALLLLLPRTGLRISEICSIKARNLVEREDRLGFMVLGKGQKWRFVPLTRSAREILDRYCTSMLENDPDRAESVWLFPNLRGSNAISPEAVQNVCRYLTKCEPALVGLTPHVLRHQYATEAIASCEDPIALREALGHTSRAKTPKLPPVTLSYIHPEAAFDD